MVRSKSIPSIQVLVYIEDSKSSPEQDEEDEALLEEWARAILRYALIVNSDWKNEAKTRITQLNKAIKNFTT